MSKKYPVYDKLIAHTDNWIFDTPDTNELREMMHMKISEEDAGFLETFPHFPSTLSELAPRFDMDEETLLRRMKPLLKDGLIYEVEGKSATRYSLVDGLFAFGRMPGWLGRKTDWDRRFAPLMNLYYDEAFGPRFMAHPTKGLRAIPIGDTVKESSTILPYEDLLAYVENEEYHTVSTCACRHNINMDASRPDCKHEEETCLHFGRLGKYIVKHGMGRKIEKEETLEILKRCAERGLVHAISNTKEGMDTICNCCSCCCIFLRPIKQLEGVPVQHHQRSNYRVEVNTESCIACGLCAKRCPIDAIQLVEKESPKPTEDGKKPKPKDLKEVYYNEEACIGCGVCAYKCPTQSLTMVRRDGVEDIPGNFFEAGMRMIAERGKDPSTMF